MDFSMFNIDQLRKAPCWNFHQDVKQFCQPLKDRLNITYFDYSRFYPNHTCIVYFSDRDYVEYFTPQKNFKSPVGFLYPGKYLWQTYIPQEFLQVAEEQFNYSHGITIFREQDGYCELFNFAGPKDNKNLPNLFLNHFELLEAFIGIFIDTFSQNFIRHYDSAIILPKHQISNKVFRIVEKDDIIQYTHDILNQYKVRKNQKVVLYNNQLFCLSLRECECLQLLLKAYSHKEIAQHMNVKLRTASVFCQNVFEKIGVKSHTELLLLFSKKHSLLISE